jgi:hypothetical protein
MKKPFFLLSLLFLLCSSCKEQLDYMNKEIIRTGHIPYSVPLQFAGPGTLIGGQPNKLNLIAAPETCFPSMIDGVPTNLKEIDSTSLPKRNYLFNITGNMKIKVFDFLKTGNSVIRIGTNFHVVQSMTLEMKGASVEYFDSVKLTQFYRESMSPLCKDYLDKVGFIIQALKVDKLIFEFKDAYGHGIELSMQNLENIVDIDFDVNWKVENKTQLIIETPKYIGYQLGSLQRKEDGMILYRATQTKKNKFVFKPIALFKDESSPKAQTLKNPLPLLESPSLKKFKHLEQEDEIAPFSLYRTHRRPKASMSSNGKPFFFD